MLKYFKRNKMFIGEPNEEFLMEMNDDSDETTIPTKKFRVRGKPIIMPEVDIFNLVSLVESEEAIWNGAVRDYSDKIARANAWERICEAFKGKYDEADLRTKWTNLRVQYKVNSNRLRSKGRTNHGTPAPVQWKYFSAMNFIGLLEEQQQQQQQKQQRETIDPLDPEDYTPSTSREGSAPKCSGTREGPSNKSIKESQNKVASLMEQAISHLKSDELNRNRALSNYIYTELESRSAEESEKLRNALLKLLQTNKTT